MDSNTQPKRLKLTMPSPDGQRPTTIESNAPTHFQTPADGDGSTTPPRPSYSPVTPTMTHAGLNVASTRQTYPDARMSEWIDEPPPIPFSLDDNEDAIALRAALSVLQVQKQRSARDIRALNKMRDRALENPEAFLDDLKAGKLTKSANSITIATTGDDDSESDACSAQEEDTATEGSQYGSFPEMQNVARCPPINWAKYHVVGESLDKLHEEQRRQPNPGVPQSDERPLEHVVAAPYRPFIDRVDLPPPMQTRSGSKNEK